MHGAPSHVPIDLEGAASDLACVVVSGIPGSGKSTCAAETDDRGGP